MSGATGPSLPHERGARVGRRPRPRRRVVRAGAGVTVLDVATGGGHVARRLRELGVTVVTADPAPGMQADSTAPAEALPFADGSFDAVVCRLAAHHFADIQEAVSEMARVAKDRRRDLRQHVRAARRRSRPTVCVTRATFATTRVAEWRELFERAGLEVDAGALLERPHEIEPWLARIGCAGDDAAARPRAARRPRRRTA